MVGKRKPDEVDVLLDHDYDGIREYDNNLPRWYNWFFAITVVIGIGYLFFYTILGIGDTQVEEYHKAVEKADYKALPEYRETTLAELLLPPFHAPYDNQRPEPTQAEIFSKVAKDGGEAKVDWTVAPLTGQAALSAGETLFEENCVSCHARGGGGDIGPNLTDKYWIHGGTFAEEYHIIKYGVPAKGMIAWKNQMDEQQLLQVSSYAFTLRGTSPPSPKAPQGEEFSGDPLAYLDDRQEATEGEDSGEETTETADAGGGQ